MSSIVIGIAHAAWDHRRHAPLERLNSSIRKDSDAWIEIVSSQRKEHASVWAHRLWTWGARRNVSHCVFLNDDVTVCPDFADVCHAMVTAVPDQIISLQSSVPIHGVETWARSYWLTGPGYIVPTALLGALLTFADAWPDFHRKVNEDNFIMQWAWREQRPIWHAVPAIVQHDTTIPSTLGYDHHALRESSIPWTKFPAAPIRTVDYWTPSRMPPLVDCPWLPTSRLQEIQARKGILPECAFCRGESIAVESPETGAALCRMCIVRCVAGVAGVKL